MKKLVVATIITRRRLLLALAAIAIMGLRDSPRAAFQPPWTPERSRSSRRSICRPPCVTWMAIWSSTKQNGQEGTKSWFRWEFSERTGSKRIVADDLSSIVDAAVKVAETARQAIFKEVAGDVQGRLRPKVRRSGTQSRDPERRRV